MTDTQERFLRAILGRVPLDSVVELHLFPAIRRGTVETGVAVIATVLPTSLTVVQEVTDPASEDADPPDIEDVSAEVDDSPYSDHDGVSNDAGDAGDLNDTIVAVVAEHQSDTTYDESGEVVTVPTPSPRLRILTASYRHTIKGIERGKWIVDVQEEADAPRDAVEAVLRGVRHRSTEPADPELISHDVLAALLTPNAVAPAA